MSTVGEKLRSRGHWLVRIHPERYEAIRPQRLGDLETSVRNCAVALRGWDFPHFSTHDQPTRSTDYIEQSVDWHHHVEMWRAYKSGQFVSLAAIWDDWRDQSGLWPAPQGWQANATINVEDVVFRFVEIYEFAARWSQSLATQGALVIECRLRGLQGRTLQLGPRSSGFSYPRICNVPEWTNSSAHQAAALLADARELAIAPAIGLFEVFGWDTTPDRVRAIQDALRR